MAEAAKARGTRSNATGRFEREIVDAFDVGWTDDAVASAPLRATLTPEHARTVDPCKGGEPRRPCYPAHP